MTVRICATAPLLSLILLATVSSAVPSTAPSGSFTGQWDTTYGLMRLTPQGNKIRGTYYDGSASISGTVDGRKFTFQYAEPQARGEGWFELSQDGKSFDGKWRQNGSQTWQEWHGTRTENEPFTGLWKTDFGRMRLWQHGNQVQGIYDWGGRSTISGSVDGKSLKFTYDQPDGEKGAGQFTLEDDVEAFGGAWKTTAGAHGAAAGNGGTWTGTRVQPQQGVVWLVVLEAPWETSLDEKEYSFGQMLRTFFARVPTVQVRHRFFYNEKDLRQLCSELPYFAEPLVLYISSHGTKDGISAGRETIDAKALADCVRDLPNLRLLHLGACEVAGGDVPKQIYQALGNQATFPISGYRNDADWAGSAVIDFTYLDLIFSRRLSPAQAAAQTLKMLSFADSTGTSDVIPPAGFVFIEPPRTPKAGSR